MCFETILECINESGYIIKKDKKLFISNVKKLTIFISSNSDFYTKNFREKNLNELSYVKKFSFEDIKNKHIKDFQSFYDRINFFKGSVKGELTIVISENYHTNKTH